jgi:hypothetical protein
MAGERIKPRSAVESLHCKKYNNGGGIRCKEKALFLLVRNRLTTMEVKLRNEFVRRAESLLRFVMIAVLPIWQPNHR